MGNEESQMADDHFMILKFVLSVFRKTINNIMAPVGDSDNTNKAYARRVGLTLSSFHRPWFNLAAQDILANYSAVVTMVHEFMNQLSFHILSAKLRQLIPLWPKLLNQTRWGSAYKLMQHYVQRNPFIQPVSLDVVQELPVDDDEYYNLHHLLCFLEELDTVTNALQNSRHALVEAQLLFDGVMERHPATCSLLETRSSSIENPTFENGVAEMQCGSDNALTRAAHKAIPHLLREDHVVLCEEYGNYELSLAERLLKSCNLRNR